jgi:hypothetical protein
MTKLNPVAPFVFAVLAVAAVSIEPALAGTPVPAPVIGAGLPVLVVLGGGYWLMRKLRARRISNIHAEESCLSRGR